MDETRERELKLDIEPAAAQQLRGGRVQGPQTGEAVRESLTSVYYDTKKFSLYKRGVSLRIRFDGDRRVQTLKGSSEGGAGIFDRPEWEAEIEGEEPDLASIERSPFAPLVSVKRLRGRLRPAFTTEVDRTRWRICSDAAEIEVALDEGRVIGRNKKDHFTELELELKRGPPIELFKLARALLPGTALKIGVLTKSERGYALVREDAPTSFKSGPVGLQADLSTAEAFKAIVRACIRHFRLNERLLLQTRGAEPLHQTRVALRRLRSALSVFKDVIAGDQIDKLKARLRSLSQQLGEARDLDVFVARLTQPESARRDMEREQAEFLERAQNDREQAYDRVIAALQGKRFQSLMFDVLAWSETGPWHDSDDQAIQNRLRQPVETFAAEALDRRRRKIRKRGRRLEEMNPLARHDVRIEAKKLRYATEFFSSLAMGKKNQKRQEVFARTLEQLQEHLGELNDLATGDRIVRDAAQRAGHQGMSGSKFGSSPAIGVPSDKSRELKSSLAAATSAFRDFSEAKPFWASRRPDAKA